MLEDVVIIGTGPAGIAAAIQLQRYDIRPVLLEREAVGGLLRNANLVENYPGFPDGIAGLDLIALFKKHLEKFGIQVHYEEAQNAEYQDGNFFIQTNLRLLKSKILVVASGTIPKKINDFIIPETLNDRVFYEIHPIRDITSKRVAIIGAGDAAFDYALNLSGRNTVFLLNRNDHPKCIPVLRQRAAENAGISVLENIQVKGIQKQKEAMSILIHAKNKEAVDALNVDYMLIAVGRESRFDFIGDRLKKDFDRLKAEQLIHTIGDVQNGRYRQTTICVGDGVKAAMMIFERLKGV